MPNIFEINPLSKKDQPIHCSHCASTLVIRYGKYQRAHPEGPEMVDVQRYRCKAPACPLKTFSLLPYPFLPIIRHFHWTLQTSHILCNVQKRKQIHAVNQLGLTRGIIKRLNIFCRRFMPWFDHEKKIAEWGSEMEADARRFWADFTRDFSQALYPKRWLRLAPTQ